MGVAQSRSRKSPTVGSPSSSSPSSFRQVSSNGETAAALSRKWSPKTMMLSPRRRHGHSHGFSSSTMHNLANPSLLADDRDSAQGGSPGAEPPAQHHSARDAPAMSPKVAAIEARTFAAARSDERDQHQSSTDAPRKSFPDRPEARPARTTPKKMDVRGVPVQQPTMSRTGSATVAEQLQTSDPFGLSENWLINRESITLGKTIGHSSFGTVNEGRLNGTKVAVKTIRRDPNKRDDMDAIAKEAELNCKLRHPNIVLFMGISMLPHEVCIVTELMARGNVRDLLVANAKGKQVKLDLSLRLQWALDTAQGMAYLHSLTPPMIHRDLKTTNLLVDRGMNVKICDFGLSRFQADDKIMTAVGTVQFAAPEVLKHEKYNEKVDLFSYGTVLWELYTRAPVFKGLPQLQVYKAVIDGTMPTVDAECDSRYRDLMQQCWRLDPAKRPDFRDVIDKLSQLVDAEEQ